MRSNHDSKDSPNPMTSRIVDEGRSQAFIPYPAIGENLEHVPVHVRPDVHYYTSRMAFLPNAIKLYLHAPWIAEFLMKLTNAVMRDERNSLSEHLKYRLAFIASRDNKCAYCTSHHAGTLKRRWNYSDGLLEKVLNIDGPADEREAVAMEFVHQASLDSTAVSGELRARLANHFTPQEVIEIVTLVGFWKMYNTMHNIMDVPVEDPVMDYKCWMNYTPGQQALKT